MALDRAVASYLEHNHSAAMITTGVDGVAKAVRVGVAVVDGELWSSGTQDRARTKRLRRDPRCTLFLFSGAFEFLTLQTTVTLLDGPDVPEQNLRLMRTMQNRSTGPLSWFGADLEEADFLDRMREEGRLVYQFAVSHHYGTI